MAARVASSTVKPSCAANLQARSGRSPSSRNRSAGSPMARMMPARGPASRRAGRPSVGEQVVGHGVDREVPPGQVVEDRRGEGHRVGTPPVAVVRLRAEGGHLEGRPLKSTVTVPCLMPVGMTRRNSGMTCSGRRVRGDVVVGVRPAQEDVADGAPDEVALEARRRGRPRRTLGRPGGRASPRQ